MEDPLDKSRVPLVNRVPPPSLGAAADLRPRDPEDVRWYLPSFAESVRLMGWRCVYFLPAIVLVIILILLPLRMALFMPIFVAGWKLVLVAIVLPTAQAVKSAKQIIQLRKEPFCIHCGYDLTGHPDNGICPECGEPFTFRAIEEYRRDPHWFIKRYSLRHQVPVRDVPFDALPPRRPRSRDGT